MNTEVTRLIPPEVFGRSPFVSTSEQQVNKALLAIRGKGRGEHYQDYMDSYEAWERGESPKFQSLSEAWARRIVSRHNKNILGIIVGDTGSGKSMSMLSVAVGAAKWLAHLRGGSPSDYFDFKDSIGIIDPTDLQVKLSQLRPFQIFLADDASPSYDSRRSQTNVNLDVNYALQTMRVRRNIVLISTISPQMIDITARRIAQFYIETAETKHDLGLTFLKVFHLVRDFRQGKLRYKYPTKMNMTAVRYYSFLPPAELKKQYDKVRDEQTIEIMKRREKREAAEQKKAESEKGSKDKWTLPEFSAIMDEYAGKITSVETISEELATNPMTIRRYMKRCGYRLDKIPKSHKSKIVKVEE